VKVGIYARSLDQAPASPFSVLDTVKGHGLDGCLFPTPLDVSATLDPGEIREARAYAESLGLYLDFALGQINPYHFANRKDVLGVGDGDFRTGLERLLVAAAEMGCRSPFFTVGALTDRFSKSVPWADQLIATRNFLISLRPFLLEHGYGLDIKTHEEIASAECVEMVEAVGPDVLGIGLDPVNVLVRLEAPLAATRRVAPYTHRVFLSDADLFWQDDGVVRKLRAVGDGILDWPGMLAILKEAGQKTGAEPGFTIELHRGQFGMPIFDSAWVTAAPEIAPLELADIVRLTTISERKLTEPDRLPKEAQQVDVLERLPLTLASLPALRAAFDGAEKESTSAVPA
jgi:sugar phosphate isomerase/epimerase